MGTRFLFKRNLADIMAVKIPHRDAEFTSSDFRCSSSALDYIFPQSSRLTEGQPGSGVSIYTKYVSKGLSHSKKRSYNVAQRMPLLWNTECKNKNKTVISGCNITLQK